MLGVLLLVVLGIATVGGAKCRALWGSYERNVKMAERTGFYVVRARELGFCLLFFFCWNLGLGIGVKDGMGGGRERREGSWRDGGRGLGVCDWLFDWLAD